MIEQANERPMVVCICGVLAAGKTTLIRSLSEQFTGSAVLVFDEYQEHCEWPQDLAQWMAEGCDPSDVRNPRLMQDLKLLRSGNAIHHPTDEHTIEPSPIILLEDPFGRTRPDNADLIDLVLFVDLPWDLSVARMVQRALGLRDLTSQLEANDIPKDEIVARIDSARAWLAGYVSRREMYTRASAPVRATADVILDAMNPADAVSKAALGEIEQWMKRGCA